MDTLFVVLCISIFVDNDKFFLNQNKKRRKISFSLNFLRFLHQIFLNLGIQ